jgi:hypothetical protein
MIPLPRRLALLALLCAFPDSASSQEPGAWARRAELLAPNSEFAVAEVGGKLYILGGYPANRVTVTTVQVYDTAADTLEMVPTCRCATIMAWP